MGSLASPPTARAVAIVELLNGSEHPLRISEITQRLGLNRSTCAAILDTLEQLQWVERTDDLTYRVGPGLIPVANAVRGRLPILGAANPVMRELVHRLDIEAVTLSRLDNGFLTLVETVHRNPDFDVRPAFRLPMFPPFGAAVVAFASESERANWVGLVADQDVAEHIARVLDFVRRHGVAIWHHDRAGQLLERSVAANGALNRRLGMQNCDPGAQRELAELALALGRSGYVARQLRPGKAPFAVSYLAAPVFDAVGQPCFSLELHVLRADVTLDRLRELVAAVRAAADDLTGSCGGDPSQFAWHPIP
jgi:DNA-binding IclR family transcriptional regulator